MGRAKCERCVFRAPANASYRCDYCAATGRTRLAVPPEKCRHFRAGDPSERTAEEPEQPAKRAAKRRHAGNSKPRYDWERGKELYDQGLSDATIAKELGCHPNTVLAWRKRRALGPTRPPAGDQTGRERIP